MIPADEFSAQSGDVRKMTVSEWLSFLRATAVQQRRGLEDVAKDARNFVFSSKHIPSDEKDRITRTINRAVEMELGGGDIAFIDDPANPVISFGPPKVEGRYAGGRLFLDPETPRRIWRILTRSTLQIFLIGAVVGLAILIGVSALIPPLLGAFIIALIAVSLLDRDMIGFAPRLRRKEGVFFRHVAVAGLFVAVSFAALRMVTASFGPLGELPSFGGLACFYVMCVAVSIADLVGAESKANFYEKRRLAGVVLLGGMVLIMASPALLFAALGGQRSTVAGAPPSDLKAPKEPPPDVSSPPEGGRLDDEGTRIPRTETALNGEGDAFRRPPPPVAEGNRQPSEPVVVEAAESDRASTLQKEATRETAIFWRTKFTECSFGRFYTEWPDQNMNVSETRYQELVEPKVSAEPEELTDADRLNGIEWKGQARIRMKAARTYQNQQWGDYTSDEALLPATSVSSQARIQLKKQRGVWSTEALYTASLPYWFENARPARCEAVRERTQ